MRKILLTQGFVTLVDDEDYQMLKDSYWQVKDKKSVKYAMRSKKKPDGSNTTELMHRVILGVSKGEIIDHVNGDGLDNRKENLRVVNQSQNSMNRNSPGGSSKFKGVFWSKEREKWRVQIYESKKKRHIGYFDDEKEAARRYNEAAIKYFGQYAKINVFEDNE